MVTTPDGKLIVAGDFTQVNGTFQHDLLPGWQYTRAEVEAEMIPDLELLAERGIRPTEATGGEAA